jgi:putative hemolysin
LDEPPSFNGLSILTAIPLAGFNLAILWYILIILFLLVCVALMSAAEVSFFSITRKEIDEMPDGLRKNVLHLLDKPKKLLATILVIHNGVNLSIVILSEFLKEEILPVGTMNPILSFLLQVVLITLIILLFGEVVPKVYGTQNAKSIIKVMVRPLLFLNKAMIWMTAPLMLSSSLFDRKLKKNNNSLSAGDLEAVIELTKDETVTEEEKKIWKGIVEFGTISVNETMKPRMDVVSLDIESNFKEVLAVILEAGYSRLPVYRGSFDKIEGVLYIKDLLPYLNQDATFDWQSLIRPTYFVPETKKIDDLLKEFQEKKVHMAIVVDEYGGSSGIVTLEDVIEEIVGEINDEFDDDEIVYSRLDDDNYVFEGKTSLINMCRIIDIEYSDIEPYAADADTIAGLLLELNGTLPEKEQIIDCEKLRFKVESVDKRRIKRVKVTKQQEILDEKE